jgi:hypothetical protein
MDSLPEMIVCFAVFVSDADFFAVFPEEKGEVVRYRKCPALLPGYWWVTNNEDTEPPPHYVIKIKSSTD